MKRIFCFFAVFMLLPVQLIAIGNAISQNGSINVPYSSNVPNIDGQWSTPNEWTDASETKIQNDLGWTLYIRAITNQTHVFFLLDFITDQSDDTYDFGGVCFDTKDDGGAVARVDDYIFSLVAEKDYSYAPYWSHEVLQGTGKGGTGYLEAWTFISAGSILMEGGFASLHDPYEGGRNHRIYEIQVPCSFLGKGYFYGFYAFVWNHATNTYLEYPIGAGGPLDNGTLLTAHTSIPAPGNWGDITSNTEFVPEFPVFVILPVFMTAVLLTAIIYRRKMYIKQI